jgi:NAD(P)-dependent dehydrogenase (short-subunit alcohol dehydrogenase family)
VAEGDVVVVTGGTGLVGAELSRAFREAGYRVVVVSRRATGDDAVPLDLAAPGAAATLARELEARAAVPHVLVNAARDVAHLGLDGEPVSRDDWLASYALDVVAPYELSVALARAPGSLLRAVVNVGSMYGVVAPNPALYEDFARDSAPHYGVGKAALAHLTKELAVRLGPRVRVNAVSYGGVHGRADAEFERRYARLCVLGRMLDAAEIGGPAVFLASVGASGVTGQNLVVDGGWTVW